jgi:dTDP-4-dehydrorhamnose reductase
MGHDLPVLVVGADGVLGAAVAARLAAGGTPVVGTSRRCTAGMLPLDLAAAASSWQLPGRLHSAVLCAAVTSVAECRMQPAHARLVNVDATVDLAARLIAAGARVVFLSSNQVFDGAVPRTPADAAHCPRTAYGRMKAEAEIAILGLAASTLVVRLTKVVHGDMPLFAGWRDAFEHGQPVRPFADLPLAPLAIDFAATAVTASLSCERGGVVQVSATHDITYADVARRLARAFGRPESLVVPVWAATKTEAIEYVPQHTTLDTTMLRERLGLEAPDPWAAVDALAGVMRAGQK